MANDLKYRYPGAHSFSTEQKALFFGREKAIGELYQLVRLEQMIVLYGKSGLGKTSLINAGIFPLVLAEGNYEPISIRFNAWTKGKQETPSDIVRAEILKNIPSDASFLPTVMPDDGSFWYAVKTRLLSQAEPKQPLFIFDQFEELFTYPDDSVRVFAQWFSELLLNELPQRVRRMRDLYLQIEPDGLTEAQLQRLNERPIPKALISIRSDRMSLLDKLTGHVPHILNTRYELQPLGDKEAVEAIIEPAVTEGVFESKAFNYTSEALKTITDYLTNQNRQPVESFQLQIVCQSVEQTVMKQGLKTVQNQDLGDLEKIFENYYEDSILALDNDGTSRDSREEVRSTARRLIEDKLVLEKEQRRLSVYEGQLLSEQGVDENLLVQLVNSRLLRREISRLGNGFDYELSHDTLVAPVLKARKERIEKEQTLQAEQKRLADEQEAKRKLAEAEEQARIERQRAEESERLRQEALNAKSHAEAEQVKAQKATQRTRWALALAVLLLIASIYGFIYARQKQTDAENAKTLANEKLKEAYTERMERLNNEIKDLERQVEIFEKAQIQEAVANTQTRMDSIKNVLQRNQSAMDSLIHSTLKNE